MRNLVYKKWGQMKPQDKSNKKENKTSAERNGKINKMMMSQVHEGHISKWIHLKNCESCDKNVKYIWKKDIQWNSITYWYKGELFNKWWWQA